LLLCVYLWLKWRITLPARRNRQKTHIEKLKAEEYKSQYELEQISHYFSSSLPIKRARKKYYGRGEKPHRRMNYVDCMIYLWNDDIN